MRYQTLEGTQWLDDIVSTVKYFLIIYVLGRLSFGFKLGNRSLPDITRAVYCKMEIDKWT